jgi:hypothetical protein
MNGAKANGPGAAATAHRAESAAFGKPTTNNSGGEPVNTGEKQAPDKAATIRSPIFEHRKRGGGRVIVQLAQYEGARFLDIREWVERDGQLTATRKGCTMPPEISRELGEALIGLSGTQAARGLPKSS